MRVGIIVQARMSSSRLPGKVMKEVQGRPLIAYQLDRLKEVRGADSVVVATSLNEDDDVIADFCSQYGVSVFRGSLDDVQKRFLDAANHHNIDVVVRITADCPLIDPSIIDFVIAEYKELNDSYAYVTNILERTYPRGMDVEVFLKVCLESHLIVEALHTIGSM